MRVLMIGAGGVALTRPLDWVVKAGYEVWLLGDVDPSETATTKNYRYFPTVWRKYLEEFTNAYPYEDQWRRKWRSRYVNLQTNSSLILSMSTPLVGTPSVVSWRI
ncbi:hypothetical protein [Nostoc sp.]